ncbi:hypothetical protein [Ochrobactrum sp. Marseille-Q0166]|uniref:hypothetical protein n=1 Tax=Ochrobactrum sp. Marseille-Q0166 TaxID=2761105 RepID=UPI0016550D8E|nr:hypothetical protein [Ochrobactrum sp. Marseille-Q0166]MBC8718254.1 hypothetical protein [Ochrobactrum sp. Marseille-Q0166]
MSLKARIIGDKFVAALWVASITLVILFQDIITTYAQASMVAWSNGPTAIICSIHDSEQGTHEEAPLKDLARSCCSTLCQAACAISTGIAAQTVSFAYHAVFIPSHHVVRLAVLGPPDHVAETHLPRGPPAFSAQA